MINVVTLPKIDNNTEFEMLEGVYGIDDVLNDLNTSYFLEKLLNVPWDIEFI